MNQDSRPRPNSTLAVLACVVGWFGTVLLVRFWNNDLDLWPDVVCQTYVGWRLAMGDSLYLGIWDSHPPVAVIYSGLLHLFLEPSVSTAKLLVLSNAFLYGMVLAYGAWVAGLRSWAGIFAACLVTAALYAQSMANARSEDYVMIFGSLSVFSALRYHSVASETRWAYFSGLALCLALFAKPAALAAGIIAGLLILLSARPIRGLAGFMAGGLTVAIPFAVFFLYNDRYAAAYDQVVAYGAIYFRPLTPAVLWEGLGKLLSERFIANLLILLASLALPVAYGKLPFRELLSRRYILLLAWPCLEAVMALAQTTYFPYVFFPVNASLLAVAVFLSSLSTAKASSIQGSGQGDGFLAASLALLGFTVAALAYHGSFEVKSPTLISSAAILGIGVVAFLLRPLIHQDRSAWVTLSLALVLVPSLLLGFRSSTLRKQYFSNYTPNFVSIARLFADARLEIGGKMLWFDVAPTIGYLSRIPQVIPEYVSPPLFYDGYADEEKWSRVATAIPSVDVVLIWKEWLNPLAPEFDLTRYPSYGVVRRELDTSFDMVREVTPVAGRGPLMILVRKGKAPELRRKIREWQPG
jgi:hypothetical protein